MNDQMKELQDVFARSAFIVPEYQRGYAWNKRHREDLLSDLQDLDALAADKVHYTGTVVLHRGRHAAKTILGKTIDVVDVVDGQQRLTTLVVFLSVIARHLTALEMDDAKEAARNIRETYIAYRDVQKLTPNGGAAQFFLDHILGEQPNPTPASPPARALLDARVQFTEFVDENLAKAAGTDAKFAWLSRWASLITTRLGFVIFEVRDEADVGVMFESMNARGKALTQFELVKNYLLYAAAKVTSGDTLTALTQDVNHTWQHVVQTLDGADLSDEDDTFIRYHWYIWPRAKAVDDVPIAKTSNIHRAIKQTVRVADGPEEVSKVLRHYLADLRNAVTAFADLSSPQAKAFAFAGSQRAALVERALGLKRLGRGAVVMPLLMASVLRYGAEPAELLEIIRLAETFTFRLSLLERRANTGGSTMLGLALETRTAALPASSVQRRLRELIAYYAGDNAVERALLCAEGDTPDGNFYDWPLLPHLLFEYERSLVNAASQKPIYDWDAFYRKWRESIEHVLPQGENTLKDAYWSTQFTQEEWARNRHRLGNLTLTEWNSYYGNRGFDRKRGAVSDPRDEKVYSNSRFLCERELADVPAWNQSAIDERQTRIAKFAMSRWKA